MSKQHWSDYWETGMLTSLPADFEQNYDGELADYWLSVVKSLAGDAKVLDVCTGNGAVAILLKEISIKHKRNLHLSAVDASNIKPQNILQRFPDKKDIIKDIEFIANCYVEEMTNTITDRFDLIVSQYGIEYCDTYAAAQSVFELLKPNGQLVFIAHSPDTAMLDYMNIEERVFQLLEDNATFKTLQMFVDKKISVNGFKNKLSTILNVLSNSQYKSHTLLNNWGQNLYQLYHMQNTVLKQQRLQVEKYLMQNLHARARGLDMLQVSEKLQDPNWINPFIESGMKLVKDGQIRYQDKHNVGHFYEFSKV